ncbi:MAG: hypothetical protein ACFFEV_05275 [Candidatus Thorarchaeota archaeon]
MDDKIIWDYSKIPEKKWQWDFVEDHWMDVVVGESGLEYIGTDWTCQSGGGYMGGFQTFDEFLNDGPIQKMPRNIAKEVREHIEKYRVVGGSTLKLVYTHDLEGFQLTGVFVHLDDIPIHIKRVRRKGRMTIYNGSIKTGKHEFSFVFVLQSENDMKKVSGKATIKIRKGTNSVVLKTAQNNKGKIVTEVVQE